MATNVFVIIFCSPGSEYIGMATPLDPFLYTQDRWFVNTDQTPLKNKISTCSCISVLVNWSTVFGRKIIFSVKPFAAII